MPQNVFDPSTGNTFEVDDAEVAAYLADGFVLEGDQAAAARTAAETIQEQHSRPTDRVLAGVAGVARGATLGLSDAAARAFDPELAARLGRVRVANPVESTVAEVGGAVAPALLSGGSGAAGGLARLTPAGAASAVGARIARVAPEAGALAKIGGAAAGAGVEGAIGGLGSGVSELMLSEDPLTVERAVSTLSSRALYGGGIGAAAGTLGKSAELGLLKAKGALDDVAKQISTRGAVGDDLAQLDAKGLALAERAEREAIEAARVPQRQAVADEIVAFRRDLKLQKHAIITKDVDLPAAGEKLGARELGRLAVKANKQLDNILDNPAGLMKNPAKALDALQRQENALARLADRTEDLRALFAADKTKARAAALDTIAPALERNRALQARIGELTAEASSPRLQQISVAKEALAAGGGKKSLAEQMASSTVFGTVTGAIAALPVPGTSLIAPLIGARAASMVGEKVFGRLGKAMSERQARAAAAVGAIFEKGARAAKAAPPIATRVLAAVAFAPEADGPPAPKRTLPQLYRQRSTELREQVATGPDGKPVVRRQARERIAASLQPIAVAQPLLADRMETEAVRRLEFLAARMPRRPEIGAMQLGPDNWQPSDMQMRAWARYVAAAEDPDGIIERVADGTITPEDAEVMRELYPERLNDLTRQVLERLPTLQRTLPYHRRIALSVLTGVPVDPSMEPRILATLQSQFAAEPEPPRAAPQFGSVKSEVGTASERREQRT